MTVTAKIKVTDSHSMKLIRAADRNPNLTLEEQFAQTAPLELTEVKEV